MRKLLVIGLCLLLGCSKSPVNKKGYRIAEQTGKKSFEVNMSPDSGVWSFEYIEVDGHEYLTMYGTYRSGLTHSPKCPCQNK